jgi:predicted Zn-dependent peptidase
MKNIREEKGYTYGIHSSIVCMLDSGYFTISAEVGNEYVKPTLEEIKNEILRLREEKISKDELSLVQNYIVGDMLRSIDGAWKIADVYIDAKQMGVGFEYVEHIFSEVLKITPEIIYDLANKYLEIDTLTNIIAGRC